jgi:hypothetical protein
MKMRVVIKENGDIAGFGPVPSQQFVPTGEWSGKTPEGGLVAGPGQVIKEVEVPDVLGLITDGAKLHHELKKHLK